LKTAWTKNLKTDEEVERFNNSLLGSVDVLNRLKELLTEKEVELNRSLLSLKSFQSPNWELETAWKNGYAAALLAISELINLDRKV